jgi:hypothetical protein
MCWATIWATFFPNSYVHKDKNVSGKKCFGQKMCWDTIWATFFPNSSGRPGANGTGHDQLCLRPIIAELKTADTVSPDQKGPS